MAAPERPDSWAIAQALTMNIRCRKTSVEIFIPSRWRPSPAPCAVGAPARSEHCGAFSASAPAAQSSAVSTRWRGMSSTSFCVEKRLAIEADGGQHLTEEGLKADTKRTRDLNACGLRVLRFTDREILLQGAAVLVAIEEALGSY